MSDEQYQNLCNLVIKLQKEVAKLKRDVQLLTPQTLIEKPIPLKDICKLFNISNSYLLRNQNWKKFKGFKKSKAKNSPILLYPSIVKSKLIKNK